MSASWFQFHRHECVFALKKKTHTLEREKNISAKTSFYSLIFFFNLVIWDPNDWNVFINDTIEIFTVGMKKKSKQVQKLAKQKAVWRQ